MFTSGRRTYIGSRGSARVLNSEPVVKFAELNLKAVCLKMTRFLKNLLNKRWWVLSSVTTISMLGEASLYSTSLTYSRVHLSVRPYLVSPWWIASLRNLQGKSPMLISIAISLCGPTKAQAGSPFVYGNGYPLGTNPSIIKGHTFNFDWWLNVL